MDPDLEQKNDQSIFFPFKVVESAKIAKSCTPMSDTLMLTKWRKTANRRNKKPQNYCFLWKVCLACPAARAAGENDCVKT